MKRSIAVFLIIVFFCIPSTATTVQRLSLDDLVQRAQSIVHGKVQAARTHWSANGKIILTTYTITVAETIKGQATKSIDVTTVGGRIGDLTMYVSGMPGFDAGEEAVVFIERSAGYSTVLGLGQGKFTIQNGAVANSITNLSFPDGRNGVALRMGLNDFIGRIRSRLR